MPTENKKHFNHQSSIRRFVDSTVTESAGQIVRVGALWGIYCRQLERTGRYVAQKRFYRVLERNGYQLRHDGRGLYLDNFTFQ